MSVFNKITDFIKCQKTEYPWDGRVQIVLALDQQADFSLHIRIPSWCRDFEVKVNGRIMRGTNRKLRRGYLVLARTWQDGDEVVLELPMPVERVYANPNVRETVGLVALQRGPVVYCLEEVDNGPNLPAIILPDYPAFRIERDPKLHVPVIVGQAYRLEQSGGDLYTLEEPRKISAEIKAVPYYIWDNRKSGEMLVWIKSF
ncbi:MAG TPA: hypothetical protein DDW87_05495 [Firmicutes bacterium]|nr:hypothetical protein [Bacillota bacterium]